VPRPPISTARVAETNDELHPSTRFARSGQAHRIFARSGHARISL